MKNQKKQNGIPRASRLVLVAAVLVSLLAVTAFAYAGFVVYENPEEMLEAFFGENGYVHSDGAIRPDPYGPSSGIIVEPAYDRVPLDQELAAELVAPYICDVGASVSVNDYTLTVEAHLYDPATRCGLVYYSLENPNGITGYKLQSNGEIWWPIGEKIMTNVSSESYIIQDKTTQNRLYAALYYIRTEDCGDACEIKIVNYEGTSDRDRKLLGTSDPLKLRFDQKEGMQSRTFKDGAVTASPVGIRINYAQLGIALGSFVDAVCIRYQDGSEYLVFDENAYVYNYGYALIEPAAKSLTCSLNRIVDVDQITDVEIIVDIPGE